VLILILGGARSGKSRYAQSLALGLCPEPWYVATSRLWDDDHRARIERHRKERGAAFHTVEAELDLCGLPLAGKVAVIDCVTLWLSNLIADYQGDVERCRAFAEQQVDGLAAQRDSTLLVVSNELGQSLHAPTELGRKFVDLQGLLNQYIAARAEAVVLLVAGIPLYVKGAAPAANPGEPQR
jgi:adenosylcobinamide kinase / adenosylcobinamide-phosphate guanylyltransferase